MRRSSGPKDFAHFSGNRPSRRGSEFVRGRRSRPVSPGVSSPRRTRSGQHWCGALCGDVPSLRYFRSRRRPGPILQQFVPRIDGSRPSPGPKQGRNLRGLCVSFTIAFARALTSSSPWPLCLRGYSPHQSPAHASALTQRHCPLRGRGRGRVRVNAGKLGRLGRL